VSKPYQHGKLKVLFYCSNIIINPLVIINIFRKQDLRNYQWPHCFHIAKDVLSGRAFTRYKMFSTDKEWIPDSMLTMSSDERCILSGGVDTVTRCITGGVIVFIFSAFFKYPNFVLLEHYR
jgi:hypothetical protein